METVSQAVPTGTISGTYNPKFRTVFDAFVENFSTREEVGASVSVIVDGDCVVDLWGGTANAKEETPWEEDTICTVFSSTKGATALAAHVLIDAGELNLEAKVSHYWPEFAENGKASATVRMMLDHSVGVPCMRDPVEDGGALDWDYMVQRLEQEEAFWKPGTRNGYHMINFGWTVGELVRRVSGQSLGKFFRDTIGEPFAADFWIGLPEALESRVAPVIPYRPKKGDPVGEFSQAIMADRNSLQALALLNQGGFSPNSPKSHAAEIGGAGGIGNGRGMARMYAPFTERGLVSDDSIARMSQVAVATNEDATLLIPTRFGLGFMKSMDNRHRDAIDRDSVVLGSSAFGHVGAGGSIGFADPAENMSFGYTMNKMGPGILLNERGQSLVDATYQALGYESNASGVWRK